MGKEHTETKKISWWNTELPHRAVNRINEAFLSKNFTMGRYVEEMEDTISSLLGAKYVVTTNSCSSALLMSLLACGIGHGDEVIIPNRTFIATAHAVLLSGATPVLADVTPDIPLLDCNHLMPLLTNRTKAVIPVHRNGRAVNMSQLMDFAKENNLLIIEDSAQAFLSQYHNKYLGTFCDFGCFSFGITKLLSTGFGGCIITKTEQNYKNLKRIRNHGILSPKGRYEKFGFNFKFSDILACLALEQFPLLDERKEKFVLIYNKYKQELHGMESVKIIPVNTSKGEIPIWIEIIAKNRNKLISYLNKNNIETRAFHPNLSDSPHIKREQDISFPRSKYFAGRGLILPSGAGQKISDINFVIKTIKKFEENSKYE